MRNYDLSPLLRQWIGLRSWPMRASSGEPGFPPYNVEKSDDNHYRITLALAVCREDLWIFNWKAYAPDGERHARNGSRKTSPNGLHQGTVVRPFSLKLYAG